MTQSFLNAVLSENNLSLPLVLGKRKTWGGITTRQEVSSLEEFNALYQEYSNDPKCDGVVVITEDGYFINI